MIISKRRWIRWERSWRYLVLDSKFSRVFFWAGMAIFLIGIVTPRHITDFLLRRVFCSWFAGELAMLALMFLLQGIRQWIEKRRGTALFLFAISAGIVLILTSVLRGVFRAP
jgi:hypothetical protein